MVKLLLICGAVFLMPYQLMAQVNTIATDAPEKPLSLSERIGASLSQEVSSNFNEDVNGETEAFSSTSLGLSYKINDRQSLSMGGAYQKALNSKAEGSFTNAAITWSRGGNKISFLDASLSNSVSLITPTSEQDREGTSFRGAISYSPSISWDYKNRVLPLSMSFGPSIRRNFHKFSTNSSGLSNTENIIGLGLNAAYEINDSISISASAGYTGLWNQLGTYKESYGLSQRLSISLLEGLNIGIGHRTGGSVVRADGSSNLNIYDDLNSEYFTNLSYAM